MLLAWVAGYLGWAARAVNPVTVGSWALRPPGAGIAVPQVLVAVTDLALASGVLYVLLPAAAHVDYLTFAGVYAVAIVAGIASQVPGGLGVIETLLLVALPQVPAPRLLGALLAYRAIYYLAPLALAAAALAGHELWQQRPRLARAGGIAGSVLAPVLTPIAPQLIGILVFLAGAVLLVSGATPGLDARLGRLLEVVPLPLLELSHLAGSVIGVTMSLAAEVQPCPKSDEPGARHGNPRDAPSGP